MILRAEVFGLAAVRRMQEGRAAGVSFAHIARELEIRGNLLRA